MRLNATRLDPNTSPVSPTRHSVLPTAWRRVLLAGFVVQLLLILFVTAIGLQQLQTAAHNLDTVVDIHMRKLSLTKTMMTAARERTLCMFRMSINHDPFERDRLFMEFNDYGATFVGARLALLGLPLGGPAGPAAGSERTRAARPAGTAGRYCPADAVRDYPGTA